MKTLFFGICLAIATLAVSVNHASAQVIVTYTAEHAGQDIKQEALPAFSNFELELVFEDDAFGISSELGGSDLISFDATGTVIIDGESTSIDGLIFEFAGDGSVSLQDTNLSTEILINKEDSFSLTGSGGLLGLEAGDIIEASFFDNVIIPDGVFSSNGTTYNLTNASVSTSGPVAVPEPSSFGILALTGLAVLRRRR